MSYRIEYDCSVGKYQVRKIDYRPIFTGIGLTAAVFLIAVISFWPEVKETLGALLIPGDDAVTVMALQTMANDLRSGAAIYDAFRDFCRLVIHGG